MKISSLGTWKQARKTYELWAQTYPRDDVPIGNLGAIYGNLGDYDKALAATLETMKADPGSGLSYANLVSYYLRLIVWMKPERQRRRRKPTIWIVLEFTLTFTPLISCNTMRQEWSVRPLG